MSYHSVCPWGRILLVRLLPLLPQLFAWSGLVRKVSWVERRRRAREKDVVNHVAYPYNIYDAKTKAECMKTYSYVCAMVFLIMAWECH